MAPAERWRGWRRRLAFGLPTVLGLAPRGFFIPHRHAGDATFGGDGPAYPALLPLFVDAVPRFHALLELLDRYEAPLQAIGTQPPPAPRWNQSWFPRLDAAIAYAMVRDRRPARLIEVGAGHSTRFFARAASDGGLATALTAIDPMPRADLEGLGVTVIGTTLQRLDGNPLAALRAGDIFSVDSSHILMPGTDVDVIVNRLLPDLNPGVLVHVHDVFLPDDYPHRWRWRGYNEQLAIAALLHGGGYRLLWSSHYVATTMTNRLAAGVAGRLAPLRPDAIESSLWLEKV